MSVGAKQRVSVIGWGAAHALAFGSRPAVFAARAQQLELTTLPAPSPDVEAPLVALSRAFAAESSPTEVLCALAAPALREAVNGRRRGPVVLVTLLPAGAPSGASERLAAVAGLELDRRSEEIRGGAASFVDVLRTAQSRLLEGAPDVIVGSAWSPRLPEALRELAARGALLDEESGRGRVPAEGAAFLRLALRPDDRERPQLAALEVGEESEGVEALLGSLLRRVVGAVKEERLDRVLIDVPSSNEDGIAWMNERRRLGEVAADAVDENWTDAAGSLESASGAWLSVVAFVTARTGATSGATAAIALRSHDARRGVIAWDLPLPGGDFAASSGAPRTRIVAGKSASRSSVHRSERASAPEAARERLARSLLEDIGSMGLLLAPGEAGPNRERAGVRLLFALDGLAALARPGRGVVALRDVRGLIERYAAEVTPPDRARRFAARLALTHLRAADPRGSRPDDLER